MSSGGRGRGVGRGLMCHQLGAQKKSEMVFGKSDVPPDTFPPLQYPPAKKCKERSLAQSYLLVVKKELLEHLQNSEYNIQLKEKSTDVERYSDRYQLLTVENTPLALQWSRFPKELRPEDDMKQDTQRTSAKRKKTFACPNPKKRRRETVNVKEKFETLEEEERKIKVEDEEEVESCGDVVVDVVQENEDDDEEMDEGTDYLNTYFDNGEEHIDNDDDCLEEGGVL